MSKEIFYQNLIFKWTSCKIFVLKYNEKKLQKPDASQEAIKNWRCSW